MVKTRRCHNVYHELEINSGTMYQRTSKFRSSHLQMFFKIGVLKQFATFTEKQLCCFGLKAGNFIKKRLQF